MRSLECHIKACAICTVKVLQCLHAVIGKDYFLENHRCPTFIHSSLASYDRHLVRMSKEVIALRRPKVVLTGTIYEESN